MRKHLNSQKSNLKTTYLAALVIIILAVLLNSALAYAYGKTPPPKVIDAVMVGDRLVDIAYHLGVLPKAMSVRGSLWPAAAKLKTSSQLLGCPNYTTVKKKQTVPQYLDKHGIKRVILEKVDHFCLYKPKVAPVNMKDILKGREVTIEYVDFSKGLPEAVRQTGKLLGREQKAEELIKKYQKQLASAQAKLPQHKAGKKVIIFSGTYQASTNKVTLRVEAPKGYSDRFLLKPLGWVNAGDVFNPNNREPAKGYFPVRKSKKGIMLGPLLKADPDAIVMTGDSFAVQKALAEYLKANPEMAKVKAIQNHAIYTLPVYVDSGVLEYPQVLDKWTRALAD